MKSCCFWDFHRCFNHCLKTANVGSPRSRSSDAKAKVVATPAEGPSLGIAPRSRLHSYWKWPQKSWIFPLKNCDFPIKNGDYNT